MNGRENYMRGKSTSYLVDNLSFLKYSYISFYFLLHYVIELFPIQTCLVKPEQEPRANLIVLKVRKGKCLKLLIGKILYSRKIDKLQTL